MKPNILLSVALASPLDYELKLTECGWLLCQVGDPNAVCLTDDEAFRFIAAHKQAVRQALSR